MASTWTGAWAMPDVMREWATYEEQWQKQHDEQIKLWEECGMDCGDAYAEENPYTVIRLGLSAGADLDLKDIGDDMLQAVERFWRPGWHYADPYVWEAVFFDDGRLDQAYHSKDFISAVRSYDSLRADEIFRAQMRLAYELDMPAEEHDKLARLVGWD